MSAMQSASGEPLPHANASGKERHAFQRATAACRVCRSKKVRCDARDGKRCSNCAFEDIQCEIVPKRPRRRQHTTPRILPRTTPPTPNDVVDGTGPSYGAKAINGSNLRETASNERIQHESPTTCHHNTDSAQFEERATIELFDLPWSPGGAQHRQIYSSTTLSLSPMHTPSTLRSSVQDLPDYVKRAPPYLDSDDIAFLENKDAFTLPEPALRDDCLRCYFQYMHPLYPTVDFVRIWSTIHAPHPNKGKLSLLLMQALIFAGGMWADVRLVRRAGFLSRKAFRQSLSQRIRVLYDADYEDDRLVLVQSLLLWSFWFRRANDQKDGWYWVGVAHSIACTIDLQHSVLDSGSNSYLQRLRRQVWWALCNREVIGSFDMRRAPRFRIADDELPLIRPDDFDYTEIMSEALPNTPKPSEAQHLVLTRLAVEYVKLNQIVAKILNITCYQNTVHKPSVSQSAQATRSSSNESSTKGQLRIDDLVACNHELTLWRQQVSDDLWHIGPLPHNPSDWLMATSTHRAMLNMMYYMAVMAVHRPQALALEPTEPTPTGATERGRKHAARVRVRHAAQEITKVCMDFFNADLLCFLPATVVSCMMHVSIHHTFDIFSDDITIRSQASRQLDECKAMLYTLAERQFAPAWVLQTIEYILSRGKRREKLSQSASKTDHRKQDNGTSRSAQDEVPGPGLQPNDNMNEYSAINSDTFMHPPVVSADSASFVGPFQTPRTMEVSTVTGFNNPLGPQTEWVGQSNNQDVWSDFPSSSMNLPLFPDAGGFGALEDSWFDLARTSDAMVGSNWQIGNF